MKLKVLIVVSALIFIGAIIVNSMIGKAAARKIDEGIKEQLTENNLEELITYSGISVSPTTGKFSIKGVSITDELKTFKLNCGLFKIKFPHSEIIRLIEEKDFEEIHSFDIAIKNLEILSTSNSNNFSFNKITIGFDGKLNKDLFQGDNFYLPESKQKINILLQGVDFASAEFLRELALGSEEQSKIGRIDKVSLEIVFDPNSNEIIIDYLDLKTPVITLHLSSSSKFTGESLENLVPVETNIEYNLTVSTAGLEWGKPDETGRYSLQEISVKFSSKSQVDGLSKLASTLNLKNYKIQFTGEALNDLKRSDFGEITGIDFSEIVVSKLTVSVDYDKEDSNCLTIYDTELYSSLVNASLEAEMIVDERGIDDSFIRNAKIILRDIDNKIILGIEKEIGQPLPRDDKGNIILEISGKFDNPKIKGLEL